MLDELKNYVKKFQEMGFSVEMWSGEDDQYEYFTLSLIKQKEKKRIDYVT